MAEILADQYQKINQRQLQQYVKELGMRTRACGFLSRMILRPSPRLYAADTRRNVNCSMAMRDGASLKIHRDLDGDKQHLLHPLDGEPEPVAARTRRIAPRPRTDSKQPQVSSSHLRPD